MSPVDNWQAPSRSDNNSACVPLPTPGAPSNTSRQIRPVGLDGGFEQIALPPLSQAARSGFLVTSDTFVFTRISYDRRPRFSKRDERFAKKCSLHCQNKWQAMHDGSVDL